MSKVFVKCPMCETKHYVTKDKILLVAEKYKKLTLSYGWKAENHMLCSNCIHFLKHGDLLDLTSTSRNRSDSKV